MIFARAGSAPWIYLAMAPLSTTSRCTHMTALSTTALPSTITYTPYISPSITSSSSSTSNSMVPRDENQNIAARSATISDGVLIIDPDTPSPTPKPTTAPSSTASTPTASPSSATGASSGGGLPGATIGWIVVSVVLGTLAGGLLLWCCCCRGRESKAELKQKEKRRRARRARAERAARAEMGGLKEYRSVYMQEPARVYVRE